MQLQIVTNQTKKQQETKYLVIEGFLEKLGKSGFSKDELLQITNHFWHFPKKTSQNKQWIMTDKSGELLGTMLLKRKNEDITSLKDYLSLFKTFPKKKILKLLTIFAILEHDLKENEVYIDHIVANKNNRHSGVGTALLEKAQEDILPNEFLSLYVAASNTRALRLYQRKGFTILDTGNSYIRKKLISEEKWHYMVWMKPSSLKTRNQKD
ncbi:N-acetyltransferase [Vagococcus carniphilus]|uniref:GNAT family N-acetyltransferase n=1 Tax=Vagococcus carniphilus TaxID=218144 RepID=UPI002891D8E4|nr:N-acetyltransferase [Vagococcus carniphilus]MDT2831440.1 N-acetyltransferase [Vagococcus carniphilus]MDT2840162.1 N-acetyltransferase [Vagococcus carniphilus]MDT2855015.1 N-acetyltransferase [Vagococcus carniphilus]